MKVETLQTILNYDMYIKLYNTNVFSLFCFSDNYQTIQNLVNEINIFYLPVFSEIYLLFK